MYEFALKKMRDLDTSMGAPVKKSKIKKEPTNDYSRRSTDAEIESAVRAEFDDCEAIERIEYVGTDWVMGSQYYIVMFKNRTSVHTDGDEYSVVTCIDWSGNRQYGDERGIMFVWGNYHCDREDAEAVMADKIALESEGTRKSKSKKSKTEKSQIKKYSSPSMSKFIDACSGLTSEERYAFDQVISNEFVTGMGFDEFIDTLTFLGANLLDDTEE